MQGAFMWCYFRVWADCSQEANALSSIAAWKCENTQVVSEKWLVGKYLLKMAGKHILQVVVLYSFIFKNEFCEYLDKRSPRTVNKNFVWNAFMLIF